MSTYIEANDYFCFTAFLYSTYNNSINIGRTLLMMNLNQSGKSTQLEFLPPELLCQILKSVPNTKALRALLRASPRCFQVYRTCREMVLSHVTWNQITPAVVPIALDALEKRENRKLQRDCTDLFSSQRTLKEPHEIPLRTWERLLCFHEIVESFISGFTNSRLVALENSIHLQNQTSLPRKSPGRIKQKKENKSSSIHLSLSQLEYARLARAFYNLELYSSLFYDLDPIISWPVFFDASLERAMIFLQSLPDWEFEELLCVRSYLIDRLIDFLNKFEDDFMKAYLRDRPYIRWPCPGNLGPPFTRMGQDIHRFDENWMQDGWIESRLIRGLEILSAIFSAHTLPAKYKALKKDFSPVLKMSVALEPHLEWEEMEEWEGMVGWEVMEECEVMEKMESSQIGFYEKIEQPNGSWFWATKFCGHSRILTKPQIFNGWALDECDINDFRRWGYVIWDNARLDRLGILKNSPSNILATIGTDWLVERTPITLKERTMEQEEIWSRRRRSKRISSTLSEPRPVFAWENLWFGKS